MDSNTRHTKRKASKGTKGSYDADDQNPSNKVSGKGKYQSYKKEKQRTARRYESGTVKQAQEHRIHVNNVRQNQQRVREQHRLLYKLN